ncbi:hypothetical protein BOX15_Mlig026683g2, partial [Macrostomum lignano]
RMSSSAPAAFQAPSANQVRQNRQILEELQEQKKRLGSAGPKAGRESGSDSSASGKQSQQQQQQQFVQPSDSFGTFLKQDSLLGNAMIPVLPRIPPP